MSTLLRRIILAEGAMRAKRPPEQSPELAAFLDETFRIFKHIQGTGEPPADAIPEALEIVLRLDARV